MNAKKIIRSALGGNERGLRQLCGGDVEDLIGRLLHPIHEEMATARGKVDENYK